MWTKKGDHDESPCKKYRIKKVSGEYVLYTYHQDSKTWCKILGQGTYDEMIERYEVIK